jgi:spermidine dehydrogenase
VNDRTMLAYGGSQSVESPSYYEEVSKKLLSDLGIDFKKFYKAYDFDYFKNRKLDTGMYFNEATYGVSRIVKNVPTFRYDLTYKESIKPDNIQRIASQMPISDQSKKEFIRLFLDQTDFFPELSLEEKYYLLDNISYEDYLRNYHKVGAEVIGLFHSLEWDLWGVGTDSIPAIGCWGDGLPGFAGLGFIDDEEVNDDINYQENPMYDIETVDDSIRDYMSKNELSDEPYIFHFPDGNATIARLLVRQLIPNSISGNSMEDIVTAKADYSMLDKFGQDTNIRLNSTVVSVTNSKDGVEIVYAKQGALYKVHARQCILACNNGIIPELCPQLPEQQKEALKYNVKVPLVWVQVAMKNWHMLATKGVHTLQCPNCFYNSLSVDFPVSLGDYQFPQTFEDPVVFMMDHVPTRPHQGYTNREQYKLGRYDILGMTYQDYEDKLFDQLRGIFGSDFNEDDIAAITVNRWAHGYSYEYNNLFDAEFFGGELPDSRNDERYPHVIGRKPFGNIAIANSDALGTAYVDAAISQADRAVNELLKKGQ